MKTKFSTLLLFLFFTINLHAQLPDGSIAPNITFTDIDGNTHTLYDVLDEGKSVVFDVMATWCGPCWSYHNTHVLKDLYDQYGPSGTNEIEIFMVESSTSTNEACLYGTSGCSGSTFGDWTLDIPYPIVHITSGNGGSFNGDFNINYFPTLYKVCPNRKIYEVGQPGLNVWENWITSCDLDATAEVNGNAACFDDQNANIDLSTEGGIGTISYAWSNGANTQDLTGVAPGSYSCTVSEGYGHSVEVGPFVVDGPDAPLVVEITNQIDLNCAGENSGSISTSTIGGGPNYSYQWSNGSTFPNLNNVSGGTYTLSVTDAFGCTEIVTGFINEPPALTLTTQTLNENCDQNDGSILLFANGGQGSFVYDIGQGPTTENIINNLAGGIYFATVTDENNCNIVREVIVANQPGPSANAGEDEEISCSQASITLDGSASSSGNDLTYLWETLDGNILSGSNTLFPVVDQPGNYTLTVFNATTGCQNIDNVVVQGDLNIPESNAGQDDLLNCFSPSVTLDGSQSSTGAAFEYQWLNNNGDEISNELTVDVDQAGTYAFVVTNIQNGCTASSSVEVTQDINLPVADAGNDDELTCTTNAINLDGSNSSTGSNFEYQWINSNGDEISNEINVDIDQADTYELIVTNTQNGCTESANVQITQDIDAPIADAGNDDELTCTTNSINLDGSNSSTGNNFEYQWINSNGDEISNEINVDVDQADTYELIVTNTQNGCTENASVQIEQDVDAPIADAGNDDELTCTTNSINLDGSNSSTGSNFEYQWINSNGDEISNEINVDVDQADTYELIVTNTQNGCTENANVQIEQDVDTPIADAGNDDELTCTTTSINLDGSNSSTGNNFEYQWINSNGDEISNEINVDVDQAGTYELIVTNTQNGCTENANVQIEQDVDTPIADAGNDDVLTCATNSINLDGSNSSTGNNFEYQWINANGDEISNEINVDIDQADTYELIVTNTQNGCTENASVQIEQDINAPIADAGNDDELTCTTTSINLDGSNSSTGSNFEYQWINANGDEISNEINVDVDEASNYELIVTNTQNGCTENANVEITQDINLPIADAGNDDQLTCATTFVNLDGSNSSEGNNFEYQWLNANGDLISNEINVDVDQTGDYELIVINMQNGCTENASVTVTQDTQAPIADAGNDGQLDCDASSIELNGAASSTGAAFEYTWLNSNNTNIGNTISVEVSAAESYTLIVTNTDNDCTASSQAEVTASNDFPTVQIEANGFLSCVTESVTMDGTGSSNGNNFNYQWFDASNQEISTEIAVEVNDPGSYIFLITDTDNGCTASSNVVITEDNVLPVVDINVPDILDCVNTSTTLDGSNSSANGQLAFEWLDSNGNTIGNNEFVDVSNVGEYSLVLTNIVNGCTNSNQTQVTASTDIPTAAAEANGVLNCLNGEVIISGANSSANGNISYSWEDENGMEIGVNQDVEVNNAGTYTLIVTDTENGCFATTALLVEASTDTPVATVDGNDVLNCINGSINLSGVNSSAQGNISYSWRDQSQNEIGASETLAISNPGIYTLVVTDLDNGCSDETSIAIVQDIESPIATASVAGSLNCNLSEMTIDASASSNGANIIYSWTTQDGSILGDLNTQNPSINASGTYQLLVTNTSNGCTSTASVEIDEQSEPLLSLNSSNDVVCFGGTDGNAILNIEGGVAPFTYNWSNGGSGIEINDLPAGTYTAIVTDAVGCEDQLSITIDQPEALNVQVDQVNNNICPDDTQGAIDLSVSGGTGTYSYLWSNGLTSPNIDNLESGIYTLSITDQTGCEKVETITITSSDDVAPTVATQDLVLSLDENGLVSLSANMINNGSADNCGIASIELDHTSFDCSNLGQNEVMLTVTDLAGNAVSEMAMVTILDEIAPSISCIENIVSNSCQGITYTLPSASDNCAAMTPVLIEGLPSGAEFPEGETMVTYQVEDMAGNIATCSFSVTVENTLESEFEMINVSCFEESDGSITALPTGGVPGYTYLWDNGETTQGLNDLSAGDYSVVITDGAGCQVEQAITLSAPDAIEISLDNVVDEMENGSNGAIEVSLIGGTPGYTYQWTDINGNVVSDEQDLLDVPAGEYTLLITDANGCTQSSETFIVDNIVSTSDLDFEKYIRITPNPTGGELSVNIELEESMIVQLDILDITGKVLLEWNQENTMAKNYHVNLSDFPNGIYLARIIIEGEAYVQRIVLAKQ